MLGLTFPNGPFAVAFALLLLAPLAVASWVDWRTLRIPKRLTVGLLAAGLAAGLVRGVWLGCEGKPLWAFGGSSGLLGGADGLLFALCGAATGFIVFFGLWATRIFVGGGDVKLVTAAGAWLGPLGILLAAFFSLGVFGVVALVRILFEISQGVMPSWRPRPKDDGGGNGRRRVSYSLSFTVGVVILLAYASRGRLGWGLPDG